MMKKHLVDISIVVLFASFIALLLFSINTQSRANISTGSDVCTTPALDSLQIETAASSDTAESGAERAVVEFTG